MQPIEKSDKQAAATTADASRVSLSASAPRQPTTIIDRLLSCPYASCPFSNAIVFLSSCVRGFHWVSDTLLLWHGAEQVARLQYWSRETIDVESLGPVVPESLSFPDRQKLVLVGPNRLEATLQCVDDMKRLRIRDLVLFFDWRVLEDWQEVEGRQESQKDVVDLRRVVLEKRFFGFTCWSSDRGKVVFMHRDLARMPRRWLDD